MFHDIRTLREQCDTWSSVEFDRRLSRFTSWYYATLSMGGNKPQEASIGLGEIVSYIHSRSSRILPRTTSLTWHLSFRCLMQGHCPCTKASAWIKGTLSRITITKSKRQVRQPIHHDTRESSQNWHLSFRCLTISIDKSKTPTASWRANDCGH
jgi:hypothetical protein